LSSYVFSKIGGRIADLKSFASRVNSGSPVQFAVEELIQEAEQRIRREGFGGKVLTDSTGKKWTQVQLWRIMKRIVESGSVPYDDILFSALNGDNDALKALVKENLISILKLNGNMVVTACCPLDLSAFRRIVKESPELGIALDILEKRAEIAKEANEVRIIEEELIKISDAESRARNEDALAIFRRRKLLSGRMDLYNQTLEKKEEQLRKIEAKKNK